MKTLKPVTTIPEQISILRERGMDVDPQLAQQWLSHVGYYRLSAYWYPARQITKNNERSDQFVPETSFADVVALYEADRKLRTLIYDGIERIEIACRSHVTNLICINNSLDPLAYTNSEIFRPNFDYLDWIETAYRRLNRARKRSESVKHYLGEYSGQFPLWVIAETMDFSDISKLYAGLKSTDQREIAEHWGIRIDLNKLSNNQQSKVKKSHPLASWLEQITIIRNTCAHHGRVWNRSFVPASTTAMLTNESLALLPNSQSERVFGALVFMAYLLQTISPGTTWPEKAISLLVECFLPNPFVTLEAMGIPEEWNRLTL
ncbi:abortive infection bacteriophage resistance protein [Arcanobacterium pluranimalium]|uniref:Abi family protein n=1 Tax=Arcanobacterium pluranimalium TaxID=108028 RepID=UPI00195F0CA7|nr:Abi family protein [Arcanobacterium pluranimalium]MBM7824723.1 abortive infection bacteriophage resistance protein [Arcanobacterium pluranimalium]